MSKIDTILEQQVYPYYELQYHDKAKEHIKYTKQALYKDMLAIVGEDENELAIPHRAVGEFGENKIMGMPDHSAIAKNKLRQELRNKLRKYYGAEE